MAKFKVGDTAFVFDDWDSPYDGRGGKVVKVDRYVHVKFPDGNVAQFAEDELTKTANAARNAVIEKKLPPRGAGVYIEQQGGSFAVGPTNDGWSVANYGGEGVNFAHGFKTVSEAKSWCSSKGYKVEDVILANSIRSRAANAVPMELRTATRLRLAQDFSDRYGSYKKGQVFWVYPHGFSPHHATLRVPGREVTLEVPWDKVELANSRACNAVSTGLKDTDGKYLNVGDSVVHTSSRLHGRVIGKYNSYLINVKWENGFVEECNPDDVKKWSPPGLSNSTNAVVAKAMNASRVARNANEPVITKLKDQLKKFGWSDADIRGAADEVSRTLMRRGSDEAEEIANLYISEAKRQAEKKSAKQKSIKEKIGTLLSKGQQICRQVILHVKKTSADLEKVIQERPEGLGRVDFTGFKSTLNDALKAAQDVLAKMTLSNPTFRGVLNASSAPVNFDSYNATVKKYAQSVHHLAGAIHALDMLQEKVVDIMISEGINTKGVINYDLADIDYLVGRMSNEWDELLMSKAEYSRFMRELRYNPD